MKPDEQSRLEIRAGVDERLHDVGVAFRRGPHERGLAAAFVLRVDGRAAREERLDDRELCRCARPS